MSNVYVFEKIDNNHNLKYNGTYTPDGFSFIAYPYFTTIVTTYNDGSYSYAYINNGGNYVTKSGIEGMLGEGVKVDLIVKDLEAGDLILPLTHIEGEYAYFSNNGLTLAVDNNGDVTDVTDGGEPGK